jgi:SAM-dependent methyltransferase
MVAMGSDLATDGIKFSPVSTPGVYERIGRTYAKTRHADSRISAHLGRALGGSRSVVNVGAGAGPYEPSDRRVTAVEPSSVMIGQRPAGSAPVVQAAAEALPFRDRTFDAAMALLTMHHWADAQRGVEELARVGHRVVILTIDPIRTASFWLAEYFPAIAEWDVEHFQPIDSLRPALGDVGVAPVPIAHDCQDGFLGAFWRRPSAYLDPQVRAGISTFSLISDEARRSGLRASMILRAVRGQSFTRRSWTSTSWMSAIAWWCRAKRRPYVRGVVRDVLRIPSDARQRIRRSAYRKQAPRVQAVLSRRRRGCCVSSAPDVFGPVRLHGTLAG